MIQNIIAVIREYKTYFTLYLLCLLVGLGLSWSVPKTASLLWINGHNTVFLDYFFKYYTYLGDGLFCLAVFFLVFFLGKRRIAVLGFLCFLGSALVTQALKYICAINRPSAVIQEGLHRVEGVHLAVFNTFPSGHATTIFSFLFFWVVIFKQKKYSIAALVLGLLGVYSRVYLAQHFVIDITTGAFIGTLVSVWVYSYCLGCAWIQKLR